MPWIAIVVIGAAVGFAGGLFGKGGSAIATPLLAAIGIPPIVAVAAPLPATVPGTFVAYRNYRRRGVADGDVIRTAIIAGVPATVAGALATRWVEPSALVVVTDVLLVAIGARMLLAGRGADAAGRQPLLQPGRVAAVAAAVGFVSGLLANGGGFLLVPLFVAVLGLPIKRALGASLAVASALAVPGTIVHAALGHIDWRVTLVFAAASVPLSGLGARTALRMGNGHLTRLYAGGLVLLGGGFLALALM